MSHAPISPYQEHNGLVFTSGQVHLKDGVLLEGSIPDITHQVMKNLKEVLSAAGTSFENVLKVTVFITDMSFYGELNEVYASYFEGEYPAREVVEVSKLPLGAKIEMSMVAKK